MQSSIRRAITVAVAVAASNGLWSCSAPASLARLAPHASLVGFPTMHQGLSIEDAAPSCYAIKQRFPSSSDGQYWLATAQLVTPEQFYCDMTTDGGGWVLIGRGRQGWRFNGDGQSTSATLRSTISGPAAFAPAALSRTTINGLLGGARVDALTDGIRVRRAADQAGTAWQEVRYHVRSEHEWSWGLGGGILLNSVDFNGNNFPLPNSNAFAASTSDVAVDDAAQRIFTWPWFGHNSQAGFSYGASIAGSSSATSYLWTAAGENYAVPFAQVWIRPQFGDADAGFMPIGDAGLAAVTQPAIVSNIPTTMNWGVSGLLRVADPDTANDSPVLALAQVGNTVFVGGRFQGVQNGGSGAPITQSFLAAFDATTGNWISGFRPTLDGLVYDLAAAPNGQLLVAGNFTTINGAANTAGFAMIDPATGAPNVAWQAPVSSKRFAGTRPWVRAIDVQGNFVYAVGSFNTISGGPLLNTVHTGGIARVAVGDGTPDPAWKGSVDSIPMDVDASADGSRVSIVGRFTTYNGLSAAALVIVDQVRATPVAGIGTYLPNEALVTSHFMQAVLDLATSLTIGGSQHSLQRYRRSDIEFERAHTTRYGGDFQALATMNGLIFASCHCGNWIYTDSNVYPLDHNYSRVAPVSWALAVDASTFDLVEDFEPQINMSTQYEGPWDLLADSNSCLWIGGDLVSTWSNQWLGGFARLCPRDATAPPAPAAIKHVRSKIVWRSVSDGPGVSVSYEILRDDRVVAVQSAKTYRAPKPGRYFVRAVDAAGNRSATTPVVTISRA